MSLKSFLNKAKNQDNQPHSLIAILLDSNSEWAEREDAAMDLFEFDELEAEGALFRVASDSSEDNDIAESCGESIAEIWCRKGIFDVDKIKKLTPAAFRLAFGVICVRRPEWIPKLKSLGLKIQE